MHSDDTLATLYQDLNFALDGFIAEVKSQGLWENTVIVQGSDFGRSLNTNSNSGTDHAWGGNYYMLGGSVKGGKIHGAYPTPLTSGSDHWLPRGRFIPTTPWESVWNAVSQWMGVHDDTDLDEVLPNRKSFSTCSLFTDKNLFTDGNCQCIGGATVCDEFTYAPTLIPTASPSDNPTLSPSAAPTTAAPTVELPDE